MADRVFRLNSEKGFNTFYCPDTFFYLTTAQKPQGTYPADLPLSEAMKRGLRGGTIIDVNGVVTPEELGLKSQPQGVLPQSDSEQLATGSVQDEVVTDEATEEASEEVSEEAEAADPAETTEDVTEEKPKSKSKKKA